MSAQQKADRIVMEARAEAARIIAAAEAEAAEARTKLQAWIDQVAEQVEHDRQAILAEAREQAGIDASAEPVEDAESRDGAWQRFGRT